jgi:hypothetical protein
MPIPIGRRTSAPINLRFRIAEFMGMGGRSQNEPNDGLTPVTAAWSKQGRQDSMPVSRRVPEAGYCDDVVRATGSAGYHYTAPSVTHGGKRYAFQLDSVTGFRLTGFVYNAQSAS